MNINVTHRWQGRLLAATHTTALLTSVALATWAIAQLINNPDRWWFTAIPTLTLALHQTTITITWTPTGPDQIEQALKYAAHHQPTRTWAQQTITQHNQTHPHPPQPNQP
jgi:hypothetical protein